MDYTAVDLIVAKRDGHPLSGDSIHWLIRAYTDGLIPDYQMSAMAMAIVFNGMNESELSAWTEAMLHSGEVMDFTDLPAPKVDKHSTGGVGDKISIPLAPLVAACGIAVPMMSGRGLAHTGGTLDKLESIAGFRTGLTTDEFRRHLLEYGLVMAGTTATIVPADRKLYALRDATGTVPSVPLISSSIMSKKLAEGLDGLLLDVKAGSGANMPRMEQARQLAQTMVGIGWSYGVETIAFITSMDQPLGNEVGNANEIAESIDVLHGHGPADVTELTLLFGEAMLKLAGIGGGRPVLESAIESGAAFDKFVEITAAHGGDIAMIKDPGLLPKAALTDTITASQAGIVSRCDALTIGIAATRLGAGRETKKDVIDPGVGVTLTAKIGDEVAAGDPLAVVRYNNPSRWHSQKAFLSTAWEIGHAKAKKPDLVLETVRHDQH